MSDLTWLNPTPHASLPPHATLASRRPAAALPGPDLHRLIAPAYWRLPSLDDLVGGGEQRRRQGEAEHPGGLGVDDEFEPGGLHDPRCG